MQGKMKRDLHKDIDRILKAPQGHLMRLLSFLGLSEGLQPANILNYAKGFQVFEIGGFRYFNSLEQFSGPESKQSEVSHFHHVFGC